MIQKIIRDTDGNVITERPVGEIEIIRPPFRCVLRRNGQEDANKGNHIVVQCLLFTIKGAIINKFNFDLWGFRAKWINYRMGDINYFAKRDFLGDTWKESFDKAEMYFNEGCDKYERLVFEREQDFKNAE